MEALIIQLRENVTEGFANAAKATDLSRVEGQLQAYQSETDRRLEKLESKEHQRVGGTVRWKSIAAVVTFLLSTGALWAAVIVKG